eukprot:7904224-Alexandrium_andersonii.AAC.1
MQARPLSCLAAERVRLQLTRAYGWRWLGATKGGLPPAAAAHAERAMASGRLAAAALERAGRSEAVARFAGGLRPAWRRWFLAEARWRRADARWHLRGFERHWGRR